MSDVIEHKLHDLRLNRLGLICRTCKLILERNDPSIVDMM